MTLEIIDELVVRAELKRAIVRAGGTLAYASRFRLRPRDLDNSVAGLISIPSRVARSIGYERIIRYAKITDESPSQGGYGT